MQTRTILLCLYLHTYRILFYLQHTYPERSKRDEFVEHLSRTYASQLSVTKIHIGDCFEFFITYEYTQCARVLHHTTMEIVVRDKHSCLLGQFIIYKWSQ